MAVSLRNGSLRRAAFLFLAAAWLALGLDAAIAPSPAAAPAATDAERRVALVIGNGAYRAVARLDNPTRDAEGVAAALRKAGFELVGGRAQLDLDKRGMERAIRDFGRSLESGAVGLFYYSGHGVEVGGHNYLIPIDGDPRETGDVPLELIDVDLLLGQIRNAGNRLSMIVLDACRNNPFGGRGLRAVGTGLAEISDRPSGTIISYATAPGKVAGDGAAGAHSPYTAAFIEAVQRPGLDVLGVFSWVASEVDTKTKGEQQPWLGISPIHGQFFFVPPGSSVTIKTPSDAGTPSDRDSLFWTSVKDSGDPALLQAYLDQFPHGTFAAVAKIMIEKLTRAQKAALQPNPEAPQPSAAPAPGQQALVAPPAAAVQPPAASAGGYPVAVGQSFRDCADCPEMVVIPAGTFTMGSSPAETGRERVPDEFAKRERPMHEVRVGRPLAVGKFHVTRSEFARFVEASGYSAGAGCYEWTGSRFEWNGTKSWRDPGFAQTDRDPVVCVNWDDAKAYVQWLARKTGKAYRLLTEAEWEYAARGGTSTARWWGDGTADQCKYAHGMNLTTKQKFPNLTTADCSDGYVFTSPVGSFAPNPFGLYDMLGDAWQWVEDCWADDYTNAPKDASVTLVSGSDCGRHGLRGGSWLYYPWPMRAAFRDRNHSGNRNHHIGFRVARTPAE